MPLNAQVQRTAQCGVHPVPLEPTQRQQVSRTDTCPPLLPRGPIRRTGKKFFQFPYPANLPNPANVSQRISGDSMGRSTRKGD